MDKIEKSLREAQIDNKFRLGKEGIKSVNMEFGHLKITKEDFIGFETIFGNGEILELFIRKEKGKKPIIYIYPEKLNSIIIKNIPNE